MSETSAEKPGRPPWLKWAVWGVALIGIAGAVYIIAQASIKPNGPADLKTLAKGDMAKLSFVSAGQPAPAIDIYDAAGKPVRLSAFKGKVVVVNLWATWCGPCKIEMPTVAKLAAAYKGRDIVVIPVSIDKEDKEADAKAFIAAHPPLDFYISRNLGLPYAFTPPTPDMPTTVIFGPDGLERARITAPADWAGEDARALIEALLAQG